MLVIFKIFLQQIQEMSVYSGFATRQQETKYNNLLQTLVIALKKRIIKFYHQQNCDEQKFKFLIKKIYKKMFILEKGKYMVPKYTSCFNDLISELNIQINYDSMSDVSSMMSQTFSLRKQNQQQQNDQLKSRTILQTKKNLLQVNRLNIATLNPGSTLSLKKPNFNSFNVENEEAQVIPRSTSFRPQDNLAALKNKIKSRQLKDLKQLRGTMHMPRVEDYLPKKQQIQPTFFRKPPIMQPIREPKGGFRRQKYSRADVSIEQI